jgi:putative flippase GtrA
MNERNLRSSSFARQISRFAISGLLATALHVVIAVALIRLFVMAAPTANGIAFAIATVFSYAINTLWSFSKPLHGQTLFRFICVSLVGGSMAIGVSAVAARYDLHYLIGIGLVAIFVPPVTFLLHRFWTYR